MRKMTLTVDITDPEDEIYAKQLLSCTDAFIVLGEIRNEIFRPARKHGYQDKALQDLIDGTAGVGEAIIERLETRFDELLEERGILTLA